MPDVYAGAHRWEDMTEDTALPVLAIRTRIYDRLERIGRARVKLAAQHPDGRHDVATGHQIWTHQPTMIRSRMLLRVQTRRLQLSDSAFAAVASAKTIEQANAAYGSMRELYTGRTL